MALPEDDIFRMLWYIFLLTLNLVTSQNQNGSIEMYNITNIPGAARKSEEVDSDININHEPINMTASFINTAASLTEKADGLVIVSHGNITEAQEFCRKNKMYLPTDHDEKERKLIRHHMERLNVTSLWLNIHRYQDDNWRWINGTLFSSSDVLRDTEIRMCAYVNKPRYIYAVECTTELPGYVCQWTDCSSCTAHECKRFSGRRSCFGKVTRVATWYEAVKQCMSLGANLSTEFPMPTTFSEEKDLWIGLRKRGWYAENPMRGVSPNKFFLNESEGTKNCGVLLQRGGDVGWAQRACSDNVTAMCFDLTAPTTKESEIGKRKNGTNRILFWLYVTVALVAVVILAITLFSIRKFVVTGRSRYRSEGDTSANSYESQIFSFYADINDFKEETGPSADDTPKAGASLPVRFIARSQDSGMGSVHIDESFPPPPPPIASMHG